MNRATKSQVDRNAESVERWGVFSSHRRRVTHLLLAAARPASRLCILGAGNCNDLDLATLVAAYGSITLVDLDAGAVLAGVARQGFSNSPAVQVQGGVDLTGVLDRLARWTPTSLLQDDDLADCALRPARTVAPAVGGPFDVVASACVLSQLLSAVGEAIGPTHVRFIETIQAVRAGHLRLLVSLLPPGGRGVLITDVVSSDTVPQLPATADADLPALVRRLIDRRNFFHGLNPEALEHALRTDPVVSPRITGLRGWLWPWDFGPRVYLVHALGFSAV